MEAVIQENEELTIEVSELNARMAVLTGDNQRLGLTRDDDL